MRLHQIQRLPRHISLRQQHHDSSLELVDYPWEHKVPRMQVLTMLIEPSCHRTPSNKSARTPDLMQGCRPELLENVAPAMSRGSNSSDQKLLSSSNLILLSPRYSSDHTVFSSCLGSCGWEAASDGTVIQVVNSRTYTRTAGSREVLDFVCRFKFVSDLKIDSV